MRSRGYCSIVHGTMSSIKGRLAKGQNSMKVLSPYYKPPVAEELLLSEATNTAIS